MSLDSLYYLLEIYWPYILAALAIGIIVGWAAYAPPAPASTPPPSS